MNEFIVIDDLGSPSVKTTDGLCLSRIEVEDLNAAMYARLQEILNPFTDRLVTQELLDEIKDMIGKKMSSLFISVVFGNDAVTIGLGEVVTVR